MKNNQKIKAYFLRLLTRKIQNNCEFKNVKKVLVFRYDRIGDMIVSTPIFRELKKHNPDIEISVLASKNNQDIIKYNPYISEIFINYKNNLLQDFFTLLKLRFRRFDVCIELDHSVITHAIIRHIIINPKNIISIYKYGRYGVAGNELEIYDYFTNKDENNHFSRIWLETLIFFGINTSSSSYDIFLSSNEREKANLFLLSLNEKIKIGINIDAFSTSKKINIFELRKICTGLYQLNNNIRIILLASPNYRDTLLAYISEMNLDYISPSFETETILEVSALIEKLDMVISPDTSIVHIASAFDIPVISIHEKNNESYRLWAPTSRLSSTVFSMTEVGLYDYNIDQLLSSAGDFIKTLELEQ